VVDEIEGDHGRRLQCDVGRPALVAAASWSASLVTSLRLLLLLLLLLSDLAVTATDDFRRA